MPVQYNGNEANVPADRSDANANILVGTDPRNASSVNTPLQRILDYLQRIVKKAGFLDLVSTWTAKQTFAGGADAASLGVVGSATIGGTISVANDAYLNGGATVAAGKELDLTGANVTGGTYSGQTFNAPTISGGTLDSPTLTSPIIDGATVTGSVNATDAILNVGRAVMTQTTDNPALVVNNTSASGGHGITSSVTANGKFAVLGSTAGNGAGIRGNASMNGKGVWGSSSSGPGVRGESIAGPGVQAEANATRGAIHIVPSGSAPSSPQDGDMWVESGSLKIRLGGVTRTVTTT